MSAAADAASKADFPEPFNVAEISVNDLRRSSIRRRGILKRRTRTDGAGEPAERQVSRRRNEEDEKLSPVALGIWRLRYSDIREVTLVVSGVAD